MQRQVSVYLFLVLAFPLACTSEEFNENADVRDEKLISTFQVVRFPNDACVGTSSRNGTCYTSAECSDKEGTSSGSCADGFGVCCTFTIITCDQTSSENITYWTQPSTVAAGTCGLTICPISDEICQLRIDFTTFVITGPSTQTLSQVRRMHGQPTGALDDVNIEMGSNYATNCFLDHFTVHGASPSSTPPTICGTNTGYHMYVEADVDRCNKMNFYMAGENDAVAVIQTHNRGLATLSARTWDMTIYQLECTHRLLPNPGCTQYYWGSTASVAVTSYNFMATAGTTVHLANQHQRICVRRERGYCTGCFVAAAVGDMNISASIVTLLHYTWPAGCCGYATIAGAIYAAATTLGLAAAASSSFGYDCIIIPGAFSPATTVAPLAAQASTSIAQTLLLTTMPTPIPPQICGNRGGIGVGETGGDDISVATGHGATNLAGGAVNISVCTRHIPFVLEFMSDDQEGQGGTAGNNEFSSTTQIANQGFNLLFNQIACA